jgi:hypothetical protein
MLASRNAGELPSQAISPGPSSDVGVDRGGSVDQSNVPPPLVSVDGHDHHGVARRKLDRRRGYNVAPTHFGKGPELSLGLQLQANFCRII